MPLGPYITARMAAIGRTQKRIAEDCGISEQYLSDIVRGNREPSGPELLAKLAAALYVNSDVLFFYAGKLAPDMYAQDASTYAICEAYAAMRRTLTKTIRKEARLAAGAAAELAERSDGTTP